MRFVSHPYLRKWCICAPGTFLVLTFLPISNELLRVFVFLTLFAYALKLIRDWYVASGMPTRFRTYRRVQVVEEIITMLMLCLAALFVYDDINFWTHLKLGVMTFYGIANVVVMGIMTGEIWDYRR